MRMAMMMLRLSFRGEWVFNFCIHQSLLYLHPFFYREMPAKVSNLQR